MCFFDIVFFLLFRLQPDTAWKTRRTRFAGIGWVLDWQRRWFGGAYSAEMAFADSGECTDTGTISVGFCLWFWHECPVRVERVFRAWHGDGGWKAILYRVGRNKAPGIRRGERGQVLGERCVVVVKSDLVARELTISCLVDSGPPCEKPRGRQVMGEVVAEVYVDYGETESVMQKTLAGAWECNPPGEP
jgi:hypothetical protein